MWADVGLVAGQMQFKTTWNRCFISFSTKFGTQEQKQGSFGWNNGLDGWFNEKTTFSMAFTHVYRTRSRNFSYWGLGIIIQFKLLVGNRIIFKITVCVITHKCMNFKNYQAHVRSRNFLIGAQELYFISSLSIYSQISFLFTVPNAHYLALGPLNRPLKRE